MPKEWKLGILLHNLSNDWEDNKNVIHSNIFMCRRDKDNMAPLTFHSEALPIVKKHDFLIESPFFFFLWLFFLAAINRCLNHEQWISITSATKGCCSLLFKPRNGDEEEFFPFCISPVSPSRLCTFWKGSFDSRELVGSPHTGCTKNTFQVVHRKIGICTL